MRPSEVFGNLISPRIAKSAALALAGLIGGCAVAPPQPIGSYVSNTCSGNNQFGQFVQVQCAPHREYLYAPPTPEQVAGQRAGAAGGEYLGGVFVGGIGNIFPAAQTVLVAASRM